MLAGRVINLSCVDTKVGFSSAPCHQVDRERLSLACLDNRVKIAAIFSFKSKPYIVENKDMT
ncbi:unnamed protein product [Brassica napus]|uniref:(rape) hypothetical protein n=1 Tax=Brassica napus TaxID=3708 RepID=A0A816P6F7_BRANA|nr:unnamed protein product [Brassica napus]